MDIEQDNWTRMLSMDERRIVVLDDDPTGTQTVSGVGVILIPSIPAYRSFFASGDRVVYVLTNTRALPEQEAITLLQKIKQEVELTAADYQTGVAFLLRGDSTLRGHVFAEVDVFATEDSVCLLVPAFPEGGRTTIGGIHYLENSEGKVPVARTEFARDPVFSYSSEKMVDWVAEVGEGRQAVSVTLEDYRKSGSKCIAEALLQAEPGTVVIPDAITTSDLYMIANGLSAAEDQGRKIIVRSASSFAAVRTGLLPRTLNKDEVGINGPVLLVCGSHTSAATRQLEELARRTCAPVVLQTERILAGNAEAAKAIEETLNEVLLNLQKLKFAMVSTERIRHSFHHDLATGAKIMQALTEVVSKASTHYTAVISKGGITSAQVATEGLSAEYARVIGQLAPGVSFWHLRQSGTREILPYAVVPGNVGHDLTLVEVAALFGVM